ncbi:hypothetical protein CDEST_05918 [Colletotrichum destructivum]|uniref:SnoaL-like domain-containing protein n=1 Tax=Colletotrichum destructivum TaxID=34406 RepID=A0AAX4ID70_9PEZI|nr:hypothetical protein CDEST_05918 [Colletotrichum destructivum]
MEMHTAEIRRINAVASEPTTNIYVSCGDQAAIHTFRDLMAADNYTKGVIECNVLVRGRYFQGNLISTISSLVVYTRTMHQSDLFKTYIYKDTQTWVLDRIYVEPPDYRGG